MWQVTTHYWYEHAEDITVHVVVSSGISSNSEAKASELLEISSHEQMIVWALTQKGPASSKG